MRGKTPLPTPVRQVLQLKVGLVQAVVMTKATQARGTVAAPQAKGDQEYHQETPLVLGEVEGAEAVAAMEAVAATEVGATLTPLRFHQRIPLSKSWIGCTLPGNHGRCVGKQTPSNIIGPQEEATDDVGAMVWVSHGLLIAKK